MKEENRFVYTDGDGFKAGSNSKLQCFDCIYAELKPGLCKKYGQKPREILNGTAACPAYEQAADAQKQDRSFTDSGINDHITSFPPCVGCIYNQGLQKCGKLKEKPKEVVYEHKTCIYKIKEE